MRIFSLAFVLVVGCGGPRPTDPVPSNVMPDAGAAIAVNAPDAAPPPPPPDAAPPSPPDATPAPTYTIPSAPRPAVKGKPIKVVEEQTVVAGGLKVKFDYASHKSNGELGMWGFIVSKGGKQEEFELRREGGTDWQAEVGVFGKLLVFTHVSYTEFTVTAVPGKLPSRLDDEAAQQLVEAAATAAGLPLGNSIGFSEDDGIGRVRASQDDRTLWRAYVGLYTKRVWFTE